MDFLDESRRAGEGLVAWLGAMWPWLLGVGSAVLVGAGWALSGWRRRLRAALADRARVDLVPSTSFAPRREQVAWMATQMRETSAAAGGLPAAARAVRVQLACERGTLAYRLQGPAWGEAVLRSPAYPDVDVLDDVGEVPRLRFDGATPHDDTAPPATEDAA